MQSNIYSLVNDIKYLNFSGEYDKDTILYEEYMSRIQNLKKNIEKFKVDTKDLWTIFNDFMHHCECALHDLSESKKKKDHSNLAGQLLNNFRITMYQEIPVSRENLDETIRQKFPDV